MMRDKTAERSAILSPHHLRIIIASQLAVVSSSDGLYAVALWRGVAARPRRPEARSGLSCPVPACGRRGRLAEAGSGSHCGVEFGRSGTTRKKRWCEEWARRG